MTDTIRLENFWHKLLLSFPGSKDIDGAVVDCYPQVPINAFNHAADVSVEEDEVEDLLNRVTQHFLSKRATHVYFRITPLTRPKSFASFLEEQGFLKESEDLIMVFKGERLKNRLNPKVKVKEISENEIDIFGDLLLTIFEMPIEWSEGIKLLLNNMIQKGGKNYLAYFDGNPVGTCSLFSLNGTGGLFNIGTLKEYRRQGIATTLIAHALFDSISRGDDLHTLQTMKGEKAEQLYKEIGFEIGHTVSWFVKKL